MKSKKLLALALSCVCALGAFALAGCSSGGDAASSDGAPQGAISVISREDGSGTRGALPSFSRSKTPTATMPPPPRPWSPIPRRS
ncbi:MAG: hypothetical protein ACLT98_09135 [Eggerthellaceae bacterium]